MTYAPPKRPQIFGISRVRIHVTQLEASVLFYQNVLGLIPETNTCDGKFLRCFWVSGQQLIQLDSSEARLPNNFVEEIGFATTDGLAMMKFLGSRGVLAYSLIRNGSRASFSVLDPLGYRITFEQWPQKAYFQDRDPRVGNSLIHAGFVVNDRATEDHFYKDILGFRPYWHGGMKDDKDDWVAMQVPDGTDWIEYMLNVSPNADHHTLGVMNHIALGVSDIHATEKQLIANGWKPTEEPKLGRDGKWQLNLYDPDDTRTEFMEFKPAQEPCCSAFTGPHPGPK